MKIQKESSIDERFLRSKYGHMCIIFKYEYIDFLMHLTLGQQMHEKNSQILKTIFKERMEKDLHISPKCKNGKGTQIQELLFISS